MYYHVHIRLGGQDFWWLNHAYESLTQKVISPYINKQVIPVDVTDAGKVILNLAIASELKIYKSSERLPEEKSNTEIAQTLRDMPDSDGTEEIVERFLLSKSPIESKSILQTLFSPTIAQVFIVMKFNDNLLDSAYEGAIKPIVKKFKYKPLRIDEVQDSGRITNQILEEIARSEVVLADLTGERPNCYYEAGFAHAIGKEIIFTIHKGHNIHFDLAGYRFIEWETEDELRRALTTRFRAIKQKLTRK